MSEKKRPFTGSAVVNGKFRFTSVSQIKLYDKGSDGCPRKFAFQYRFGKRLAKTQALDVGIDYASKLEHYLKTGENVLPPVLQPAQKYYPEPCNSVTGLFDLQVEEPLGKDLLGAIALRDAVIANPAGRSTIEMAIKDLAGVVVCGIPLDGAADFRHDRGTYKNEEGVETAEHPSTQVVEIGDQKVVARISPHKIMKGANAGTILPGWAKTSAAVCNDIQMVTYGRHAVDLYPDATHIRLSHVYADKSTRKGAKRTGLISVAEVLRRFQHVEELVGEMVEVATADKIEDVPYNTLACDSFTHIGPDGQTAKGCGHRYYCPLPDTVVQNNMLGAYKESVMSLFDKLPKGALVAGGSTAVAAPPSAPAAPVVTDERAAIEAEKARLRAEDAALAVAAGTPPQPPPPLAPEPPAPTIPCGAPGCGAGITPGWIKSALRGAVRCWACNPGVPTEDTSAKTAPPAPPAPPPPPAQPATGVTPPDAPPPAALIDAAAPLPQAAIDEITNPALKATVLQHQAEHQAREAEKARLEAEQKQKEGTNVWCAESSQKEGRKVVPTMEQAIEGKYVCVCTKTYTIKSMKQADGTFLLKRHKPVVKADVAPAQADLPGVGGVDDDDDEGESVEVVGVVVAPPPPPPPLPGESLAPPAPPAPGPSTQMVNQIFGEPPVPPAPPTTEQLAAGFAQSDAAVMKAVNGNGTSWSKHAELALAKAKVAALETVCREIFIKLTGNRPLDGGVVARLTNALFCVEPVSKPVELVETA